MDIFETEEERREKRVRNLVFVVVVVVIVVASIGLYAIYEASKPLPTTAACAAAGYEGGVMTNIGQMCYKDCISNTLRSCRRVRVLQ